MIERTHKLVKFDRVAPPSVRQLLVNTFIGTNGTRYRLKNTAQKIDTLHQPCFIYIERHQKAVGTVTLCKRLIQVNGSATLGFYVRYFAFAPVFQQNTKHHHRTTAFQLYFKALFDTSNLNPAQPAHKKSIFWAYIDPKNKRSAQMRERFGFHHIGQLKTIAFSRFFPKKKSVQQINETDKPAILKQVNAFYNDYAFFSTVHLFKHSNYYVLRKNGEIVTGIQANPCAWEIEALPGKMGAFMVKFARFIPLLNRLINPKNHRFLATEGLFWKKGHAADVAELLEGVLALTGHYSLLMWEDTTANRISELPIKWGFLQQLKQESAVDIVAKLNGFSVNETMQLQQAKKYISGFDVT